MVVAVLGGTGKLGLGLVHRLARAKYQVIVGSRDPDKARGVASVVSDETGGLVKGEANLEAAGLADMIIAALPVAGMRDVLAGLGEATRGKVVIDTSVDMANMPGQIDCAGVRVRSILEDVRATAAFQTIPAAVARSQGTAADCHVFVFGDDPEACRATVDLAGALGFDAVVSGALSDAWMSESITRMLIGLNIRYKKRSIGMRLVGL